MATVLTRPKADAAKVETKLALELSQVASRIRLADALSGGLAVLVLVLGYTLSAVVADRLIGLPPAARLGMLALFGVALAGVVWRYVARPLRTVINPRFAARQVEQTVPDAKNAIINWVDLKDQNLPESVLAAVSTRAFEGVGEADVSRLGETRRTLWLAAAAGLLVAGLAVVFVLVKAAPFASLLNRAYNPFTASGIATRTEIAVEEPTGGDVTVTSGDSLTVRVTLRGTIPDAKGPDKVRLLLRYNPEAEDFDEVPLEAAGSSREFATKLPPSLIQNGFRYRVAAGDARTPEYAVAVRTRPMLREFALRYEYPAYTRLRPETTADPRVEAYRGTTVTITVKANRTIKDARLVLDTQAVQVPGELIAESPDAARFRFVVEETGSYRVQFTSTEGETVEPAPYPIRAIADQTPLVTVTQPKEEEATLPADGLLKIDGVAADDFGLVGVTLRLRLVGTPGVSLEAKKYRAGKSFRREADGSDPTTVEYKDSVKLSTLKGAKGEAVALPDGAVVEYWLEATDNCTVPAANVGKSKVQRVRIATPPAPPTPQEQKKAETEQKQDQEKRQGDEKGHEQKQDEQFNKEERAPQQPRPEQAEPKPGEKPSGKPKAGEKQAGESSGGEKGSGEPKSGEKPSGDDTKTSPKSANDPKPPEETNPGTKTGQDDVQKPKGTEPNNADATGNTKPKPDLDAGSKPPEELPSKGQQDPTQTKSGEPKGAEPKSGEKGSAKDEQLRKDAEKVKEKLDEKNGQGGETRPENSANGQPDARPADAKPGKPQPGQEAEQTAPKPGQAEQGTKTEESPGTSKAEGKAEKPEPSQAKTDGAPKPDPNQGGTPKEGDNAADAKPTPKPQDASKGGAEKSAGGQTPQQQPDAKEPPAQGRSGEQGEAKPGGEKSQAGEAKPQPKSGRGEERAAPQKPTGSDATKPEPGQDPAGEPGQAKPETAPKPGTGKPTPKDGTKEPMAGQERAGEASREKPQPPKGDATQGQEPSQAKPDATKPGEAGKPQGEKSVEKPAPGDKPQPGAGDKTPSAEEIERAVKDLKSGNPAKQQAARDTLDKAMGKANREAAERKAEQLEKDLKSDDPATRDAARKEIEEIAKQAEKNKPKGDPKQGDPKKGDQGESSKPDPGDGSGQKPTPEQVEQFKKQAQDLNSPDDAKRQAAEKGIDDAVGQDAREQLQKEMKDAQSGDPDKAKAAKERLEKMAQQRGKGQPNARQPGGGDQRPEAPVEPLQDDPKNRLKTGELQLIQFEKAKADREFQKELGYTPEQYDEFLKGYREMLGRQREEVEKQDLLPKTAGAATTPTMRVGGGSGAKPVEKRGDAAATAGGGAGTAPPGYSDAQRKFAEEAAKLKKPEPKR